jgi:hypothetical protein
MLTDDELSRELGTAFHAAAGDLTYTGRRQPPRRTVAVALPIAAGTVAIAAAVFTTTAGSPTPGTQAATSTPAAPADGAAVASPTMISDDISLAGLTLRYERPAGSPDPLRVDHDVDRVPDNATPVPLAEGATGKAWVGVDPASGDNAIYLQSPARNGGETFAMLSSTWTQDQLVDLLLNGSSR